mmetsp:Transcript_16213/g.50819  ORF Transcript_16213/g.50819 Transcript_16213/m.50819 type:complete len:220 (+) Transcript_16213:1392-2051(+)
MASPAASGSEGRPRLNSVSSLPLRSQPGLLLRCTTRCSPPAAVSTRKCSRLTQMRAPGARASSCSSHWHWRPTVRPPPRSARRRRSAGTCPRTAEPQSSRHRPAASVEAPAGSAAGAAAVAAAAAQAETGEAVGDEDSAPEAGSRRTCSSTSCPPARGPGQLPSTGARNEIAAGISTTPVSDFPRVLLPSMIGFPERLVTSKNPGCLSSLVICTWEREM